MNNLRLSGLFWLLLLAVPAAIVLRGYESGSGFLSLIEFGEGFSGRQLPEVQAVGPPEASFSGYDGQFYAQIAIDPSLQHPSLQTAVDNFSWRSKRIGLPALAHLLGLGRPAWALQAYALLNVLFWLGLLWLIHHYYDLRKARGRWLAAALLLCTGTLFSLDRALIDLPALLISLLAVYLDVHWASAAALMAAAVLFKETAVISAPALAWPWKKGWKQAIGSALIVMLPAVLWFTYVEWQAVSEDATLFNPRAKITIPLIGLGFKFFSALQQLLLDLRNMQIFSTVFANHIFELIAPLSLLAQALYFLLHRRWQDSLWRYGAGFALLLFLLGPAIWEEQAGYTRILLPLTAAFNLLLYEYEHGKRHRWWYLAGNLGMATLLLQTLLYIAASLLN